MPLHIDNEKFALAHETFKQHMLRKSQGIPFINFQHPFLISDEIAYKWGVYDRASRLLNLSRWRSWRKKPGNIIRATKEACRASENLLEHKYGPQKYSESALYKVAGTRQVEELESRLFDFFLGGLNTPTEFAPRFDALADHLRENRLGCKWDFVAYLAFLSRPQTYFPIRSTYFNTLLDYYGAEEHISGYVSWERYRLLLDLAED